MERRRDPIETLMPPQEIKAVTHLYVDRVSDVETIGLDGFLMECWSLVLRKETANRFLTEQRPMVPSLEKVHPHTRLFFSRAVAQTLHEQLAAYLSETES